MYTTKSIDIREFVDATELDPILIEEQRYYVAPALKKDGGNKAYQLLSKALSESKQIVGGENNTPI